MPCVSCLQVLSLSAFPVGASLTGEALADAVLSMLENLCAGLPNIRTGNAPSVNAYGPILALGLIQSRALPELQRVLHHVLQVQHQQLLGGADSPELPRRTPLGRSTSGGLHAGPMFAGSLLASLSAQQVYWESVLAAFVVLSVNTCTGRCAMSFT